MNDPASKRNTIDMYNAITPRIGPWKKWRKQKYEKYLAFWNIHVLMNSCVFIFRYIRLFIKVEFMKYSPIYIVAVATNVIFHLSTNSTAGAVLVRSLIFIIILFSIYLLLFFNCFFFFRKNTHYGRWKFRLNIFTISNEHHYCQRSKNVYIYLLA